MLFSYSFTASGGSEESTAGRVVSLPHYDYAKQHHTRHCWLHTKVMCVANSTKPFSWLTLSASILLMKNVQIYIA